MSETEYNDFFEDLATRHLDIRHNRETNQAFYIVHDDNLTELITAVREKLAFPALLLDQYYDSDDTESDNNRLIINGGINVICQVEPGNTESERKAREDARRIAKEFKNRVRRECRFGGLLYDQQIRISFQTQGEPVEILAGIAMGWGYSFTLTMPTSIAVDPKVWQDLA